MGAVAKGVASLFGGRKRRQTEKDTKRGFEAAERNVEGFNFENKMAGLSGRTYTPTPFDAFKNNATVGTICLLYTSPSPRDVEESRMPSSA